jgi:hypothetical protein
MILTSTWRDKHLDLYLYAAVTPTDEDPGVAGKAIYEQFISWSGMYVGTRSSLQAPTDPAHRSF